MFSRDFLENTDFSQTEEVKKVLEKMNEENKICTCPCHKEGQSMMHFMPCCQLTYQSYLNDDLSINYDKLIEILKELKKSL